MEPVWALGLMSGTSMDGLDAAALLTDGVEIGGFGPTRFFEFEPELRAQIAGLQGGWQGAPGVDDLETALLDRYAEAVRFFPATGLVGLHGQTLAHDPVAFRTHQAGNGAALAEVSGRRVIWDFRTADVLSGGEGAPLVPVFHHALMRMLGMTERVAVLNIGGVANVTWLDPTRPAPEDPGVLLAFDTGPGNALIDDLVAARGMGKMDAGGALALGGTVDEAVVAEAMADLYFERPAPKSLDRNYFVWLLERVAGLADADAAASLAAVTAAAVAASVRWMPEPPDRWLVAGGGRLNAAIMAQVSQRTNAPVEAVEAVGLNGDFLEAQAFAYLAARVVRGLPTSFPSTTGARVPVCGGRISGGSA